MNQNQLQRPCDDKKCAICRANIRANQNGIVCTVPTRHLRSLKSSTLDKFRVHWELTKKTASFHESCWDKVVSDGKTSSTENRAIEKISDTVERYNCVEEVQESVKKTVELIMAAKSTVCFTGAGISVAAGLNTYRGADGIDTIAAVGDSEITNPDDLGEDVDYAALHPTFTHNALVRMHNLGKMDYCATQNCDNLHQKAGFPRNLVSDLHGNVFVEFCDKCHFQYVRDEPVDIDSTDASDKPYYVRCPLCKWGHYTGRECTQKKCNGRLRDTIVNFSDRLHYAICGGIIKAKGACRRADVCLCLGSSLTVYPATNLPTLAKNMIIVNLQATDLDDSACVRVYATSDMFFALLLPALEEAIASEAGASSESPKKSAKRILKKRGATAVSSSSSSTRKRKRNESSELIDLVDSSREASAIIDLDD